MSTFLKVQIPDQPIHDYNFLGAHQRPGRGDKFSVYSPYTGKVIGQLHQSTMEDVHEIIVSAKKAYEVWHRYSLRERCQVMFRFRELVLQELEHIIHLTSAESGKTLDEAKAEWLKGLEIVEYAASLENIPFEYSMEVSRGVSCQMQLRPLGVVAGITPFNFPAMVPLWMIPLALVTGNTFVWKPSDKTPLTSSHICRLFQKAGLPDGALTTLHGQGQTAESLIIHPDVKAVAFVGSTPIAKLVYEKSSLHHKRALCLGGAKNHIFLLPDADLDLSLDAIVDSFTGCAGQRCMAASVLLTVGDYRPYWSQFLEKVSQKILGTNMGAIITPSSLNFLKQTIATAQSDQCDIHIDGRQASRPIPQYGTEGHWLGPSVITARPEQTYLTQTELFGPIMTHIPCPDLSSALAIQKRSLYGNAVSIFTSSGAMAEKIISQAHAGMMGINVGVPVPREPFSFGGIGESKFGHGDITGESGIKFWTQAIKITKKWAVQKDKNWMN